MTLLYDLVDPAFLTGVARETPVPSNFILNRFLPDVEHRAIELAIDRVTRVNRVAKFRAFDAETPIGKRPSFTRDKVKLPPIGQKLVVGEFDTIMLQLLETGGNNVEPIRRAIYDDTAENVRTIRNRMELARGDVLVDGKFTLAGENGLTLEANFGVPGSHLVAPGVLWSDQANATPLLDEMGWVDTYITDAGEPPGFQLVSTTTLRHMLQNAALRGLAAANGVTPGTLSLDQLNGILQIHGLPPVVVNDARVDVDGVSTRVIPADRVVFLPANPSDLGETAWGVTAESIALAAERRIELEDAPGIVAVNLVDGDPVRVWSKATAVGMPVIRDPNRLLVADVF